MALQLHRLKVGAHIAFKFFIAAWAGTFADAALEVAV